MTTNFTLRDFFVFVLTGCTFLITMTIIFYDKLFKFFKNSDYLSDFSWGWLLLLIPGIYLIGHLFGALSYLLLKSYKVIDQRFKRNMPMPKCKYRLLMFIQCSLYRQRVVYAVIKYTKDSDSNEKPFNNIDAFWTECTRLQIAKIYSSAEYWSCLNEFFNSINLVFFVSSVISFLYGHWIIGIVYLFLSLLSFYRAKQYASHFVHTVIRLIKAWDIGNIKP